MAVITVARQLGGGGDRIAEQVAKRLGYEFVDRRLIEEIAAITSTSPEEVEKYDENGEVESHSIRWPRLIPRSEALGEWLELLPGPGRVRENYEAVA